MFGKGGCGPGGRFRAKFMMGGPFRHMGWFGGARHFLSGIDLTDEQIEQIAELKHKSFSKMGHGRVDMMELMQELFRELGKPKIDRARVLEIKDKIKEKKAAIADLMFDNMLDFAEILTPEQRKKIRIKKIRQFLGSDDEPDDDDEPPQHRREF